MTLSQASETRPTEKMLLRALILSLLLHFFCLGLWKIGRTQGWWKDAALPKWMQAVSKALIPIVPKKIVVPLRPSTPTVFIETDPSMATPTPPKNAPYYGAHNTVAANKEIKTPSTAPNIEGRQTKVLKTIENAPPKAVPLQPTPPPQPQPQPEPVVQSMPKKSAAPGDLAMTAPAKKAEEKDGKSDAEVKPQPTPPPAYHRPRTLAEAAARKGTLGEQMKQTGGVNHIALNSAVDVQGSPIGDYDAQFVAAVTAKWYQLLEKRNANAPGKVVVEFTMHPDGRITDLKIKQNEVTELLSLICVQAIEDPAPYAPWPRQMRLDIPTETRDVQFTFFYDLE